jgi:hypothetical protein
LRALGIYAGLYITLFVLHIVFAANNLDILFQVIAFILVAMTFLCGPALWSINSILDSQQINSAVYGYAISLPLSVGIAYAYTDMHFEVGASLIALSLTSLTHGVWLFSLRAK